jgi:hypothetical protein
MRFTTLLRSHERHRQVLYLVYQNLDSILDSRSTGNDFFRLYHHTLLSSEPKSDPRSSGDSETPQLQRHARDRGSDHDIPEFPGTECKRYYGYWVSHPDLSHDPGVPGLERAANEEGDGFWSTVSRGSHASLETAFSIRTLGRRWGCGGTTWTSQSTRSNG